MIKQITWEQLEKIEEILGADGIASNDKDFIFTLNDCVYVLVRVDFQIERK